MKEKSWTLHVEYRNKFNKLFRKKLSQSVEDQLKKGFIDSKAKWKFYSEFFITKKSEIDSDFPDFLIEDGKKPVIAMKCRIFSMVFLPEFLRILSLTIQIAQNLLTKCLKS